MYLDFLRALLSAVALLHGELWMTALDKYRPMLSSNSRSFPRRRKFCWPGNAAKPYGEDCSLDRVSPL